jgi:hypothetical protein
MIDHRYKARWFWVLIATSLFSLVRFHSAVANEADGLRVTDYFISHTSNEPFYAQQRLDPRSPCTCAKLVLADGSAP